MPSGPEITALLRAWARGDRPALDELTPLVYAELRHLILVDHFREHNAMKCGGDVIHISLEGNLAITAGGAPDLIALHDALGTKARRAARTVLGR